MTQRLFLTYLAFIFINTIFIFKYTEKIDVINEFIITFIYLSILLIMGFVYVRLDLKNYYKPLFLFISILFFVFTIYLNIKIDGNTLMVDRWSAMEVGIEALLNGAYPYSATDHLNGRTSNLPTLLFIGIPFYLLGNIGFLQSFAFLLFLYAIFKVFDNYKDRLFCITLLILSPSYLWEIYVKSDLMSNFIIILLAVILIEKKISQKIKINPISTSFLFTALIMTRVTAIIPISLLFFKHFYKYSLQKKIIFTLISFATIIVFMYLCFNKVSSLEHFYKHNPFELQNRQLPSIISFILILIPTLYSFRVKNLKAILFWIFIFLLLPVLIGFLISIFKHGFSLSLFGSYFDISYFNMVLPFLLLSLVFEYKTLFKTKSATHLPNGIKS